MGICTVFCQSVCDGLELEKKAITARRGVKRDPGRADPGHKIGSKASVTLLIRANK